MRIFHLSDLHIGIKLYGYDLREEQEYIFNEIIEKMLLKCLTYLLAKSEMLIAVLK